jgi:uncharacterized protein (DUF1786 family)
MRILAIDIGAGTRDVLLYDPAKRLENCVQLIVPSFTKVMARRIDETSSDLHLRGRIVGGGPMVRALRRHLGRGFRVSIGPEAAFTIKNQPSKVLERGLEIREQGCGAVFELDELELPALQTFLATFEEKLEPGDGVAVAVQDHGNATSGHSDRDFRWRYFQESLTREPRLASLLYPGTAVPDCFLRMQSVASYLRLHLPGCPFVVADTCVAALLGCLSPLGGYAPAPGQVDLVVNLGNGHTMAGILRDGEVLALFEHHTHDLELRPDNLPRFLGQLVDGTIRSDDVVADAGEGAFVREVVGATRLSRFLVTGPRRRLALERPFPFDRRPEFAAPAGNMMITGCLGLLAGFGL